MANSLKNTVLSLSITIITAGQADQEITLQAASAPVAASLLKLQLAAQGYEASEFGAHSLQNQGISSSTILSHLSAYSYGYSLDASERGRARVMISITREEATPEMLAEAKELKAALKAVAAPAQELSTEAPAADDATEPRAEFVAAAAGYIASLADAPQAPAFSMPATLAQAAADDAAAALVAYDNGDTIEQADGSLIGHIMALMAPGFFWVGLSYEDEGLEVAGRSEAIKQLKQLYLKAQALAAEAAPVWGSAAYYQGLAGFIEQAPTQAGDLITIYEAAAQGIDAQGARLAIVCEQHGTIGRAYTLGSARALMSKPGSFCPECAQALASTSDEQIVGQAPEGFRECLIGMALADTEKALQGMSTEQLIKAAGFSYLAPAMLKPEAARALLIDQVFKAWPAEKRWHLHNGWHRVKRASDGHWLTLENRPDEWLQEQLIKPEAAQLAGQKP